MASNSEKRASGQRSCTLDRKRLSESRLLTVNLRRLARRSLDGDPLTPAEEAELASHVVLTDSITAGLLRSRAVRAVSGARRAEVTEPQEDVSAKVARLAGLLSGPQRCRLVVYTGAGVSTAAQIPDYRGPNGAWTRLPKGAVPRFHLPGVADARPTFTHRLLAAMAASAAAEAGPADSATCPADSAASTASLSCRIVRVVSQNCDGLHLRSGLPPQLLSELHGNVFIEACEICGRLARRRFDVTERTGLRRHATGRLCGGNGCVGRLLDSVVHFGEFGRECTRDRVYEWRAAEAAAASADLILCLGTSLQVLRHYPLLWPKGVPIVIVNLQATPFDRRALFTIRANCDSVSRELAARLGLRVPEYNPGADPLLVGGEPISEQERALVSRPDIAA